MLPVILKTFSVYLRTTPVENNKLLNLNDWYLYEVSKEKQRNMFWNPR